MLSILLSLGHLDSLTWCELGLVGVLALGTLALHIGGTRAHRSELSVTIMGLVATVLAITTDNLAVLSLAFALALIAASCLALHAERAANAKGQQMIIAVCAFASVLYVVGASLFMKLQMDSGLSSWQALSFSGAIGADRMSDVLAQYAFSIVGIATVLSCWLWVRRSRFASFVAGAAPVVFIIALLRLKLLVDRVLADSGAWTNTLFIGAGLVLLALVAAKMLFRKNPHVIKCSGVEHIGIAAFMIGAGFAGIIPAVLHLFGQAVAQSGLWHAAQDTAIIRTNKTLKTLCIALYAATLGAPFSVLFVSQLIGVGYALQSHLVLGLIMFALLGIVSVLMVREAVRFTHDVQQNGEPMTKHQKILAIVLTVHVALLFGVGGYMLTQQGIQFAVSVAQNIAAL